MVNTLLKYLSHPLLDIKKLTYQSVVSHLKSCLSFDSPTHNKCDGIAFLLHHSILWEVACFGLSSDLPEVISCSQDLFSYLMQCRMLVSADMWKSVCDSLLPLLPVLQSYANADLTLGKCLLAFIDPHFDENISTLHCVKGAVRILFCRDSAARIDAAKVLMTRLNSTYNSHLLYPIAQTNHHANHIIHMGTLTRDTSANSKQPSLISDDSVTRVLRVFLEDGVEQSVRLTSLNQLSIILQNSLTHKFYLEKDGLEITLSTINESISPEKASIEEETVAPAISILASLLQYNQDIRQALAADVSSILTLLRCCWLFPSSSKTSIEAAQCLLYIVFNEISPISSLDVLSLPKTCCVRYKLPLRVLSYCDVSAHRVTPPPPSNDPITQPLPLQMLRIHWNIKWHGKVEHLLESLDREEKQGSGQFQLKLADILSLKESNSQYSIFRSLRTITNATTHNDVAQQLGTLTAYSQMCYLASDHKTLSTITWNTYFSRFLTTQPVAQIDKELLIRITAYFTSLLNMGMPAVNGNLLGELHSSLQGTKDSVLLSLLNDSAYSQATDSQLKRPLQNTLLSILSLVGTHTSSDSTSVGRPGRCYLVQAVLKRLTMADASNFYNLASLESSVYTLSRLTSSCGWSVGCSDIDSSFLCSQLIKALFEVLSAFHFGRQGNSSSYMGKGVLRNATLCLRYVVEEMTSVVQDTDSWLTRWVEGEEGQTRLQWLRSLWTYRDQEVRTAALGVSVALLHLSLGLSTVSSSVTDLVRDAVEVVVDSTECSLVRRQASVLLSNVIWNVIHHPTSDLDNKKELLNIHEVLRSANYYSEIFVILSSDIFLNTELNMDSLHRQVRPELGESVCNVVYPTLVTPSFLHSLLQCLILVTNSIPSATLPELETVQAAYHLIGFFLHNDDTVMTLIHDLDISDNSRVLLRNDVTSLCVTTISLLRSCIIQNKYMRSSSLSSANCRHVTKILSVLSGGHNQVESIEVLGTCKAIWCELFQYLTAHLHLDKDYEAFKILVIDNLIDYWQPLTSISMHILKVEDEESRICVLEFWTIILNTLHGYSEKEAVMARLDGADGEEKPCGALLYTCMLRIYDSLQLRYTDKDCVQERLALINCLKSLLAISHSAKLSALEAGFAETLLTHINSFIGKLNLLAMNKSGLLTEANVYLAELVVSLEVLTNFLSSFDEGKRAVSQGGLANLIHRLWFYCESDSQLMDTCVSMLITYTENSTLACRHLVCTSTVSCLGMPTDKLQIQSNSLADILVKLMQSQLNSININIGLLSKLFQLMSNFALAPDTLSVICKNAVVNGLVSSNPKVTIKRRPKLQTAVICLWIQFYLNLSYSLEGLQLILSVPDSVKFIVEQLSSVDSQSQLMILIILYNLCVGFRSKVLTIECVPLTALDILEDATSSQNAVDCALEILKALVYNSMKGKAVLKSLNIPERLEELVSTYKQDQMKYSSGRHAVKDRQSQIDNVLQILICIKE
ncbi:RTTN [Bugula neritina]|uniref:RTTN n=1 Tax=Bugula neritina TaxID=10212 RepID=A0A7J7JRM5_BUGNE|nr:RTTN [Bugula neritina]